MGEYATTAMTACVKLIELATIGDKVKIICDNNGLLTVLNFVLLYTEIYSKTYHKFMKKY